MISKCSSLAVTDTGVHTVQLYYIFIFGVREVRGNCAGETQPNAHTLPSRSFAFFPLICIIQAPPSPLSCCAMPSHSR